MQRKLLAMLLTFVLCLQALIPSISAKAAETLYNNKVGTQDGYNYELWKDYGTTSMTLNGGGAFSCQWSNIGNALFRKGVKFDSTKTYQQIGNITCNYGCDYQPNGNSYLCVYGWMTDPLVEYYIVESWGTWRPPGATAKGSITVDGGTYDVYETTRVNQPSIQGDTTFQQYWSVRTSKKTSGTISVSDHFKAWERMGMKCGKLYEAALNVEGYQSSGSANVYKNEFTVGGSGSNNNSGSSSSGNGSSNSGSGSVVDESKGAKIECEKMTVNGQYAGTIDSPFNGVALYANDESVSYTQNFTTDTNSFTLKGCSNNSNMAKVDLIIGGENKGTFYFGDEYPAEYTLEDVYHKTGNQKVELVVNADDGNWDAYVDFLYIEGVKTSTSNNNQSSNTGNTNTGNTSSNTQTTVATGAKTECENMTIGGQYAGKVDSPFDGVALYANDDVVSFTQNFPSSTNDFTLRGCSNNSNMAKVDLVIGGENKGTFYFGDEYPAEYTIENVSHKTGNQKVELIVNADDGNWDAYIDYLTISGISSNNTSSNNNTTATTQATTQKQNSSSNTQEASTANKTECEKMTIGGQYAGKVSSPFDGVALYANDDVVSYTQSFANDTHDFTLRGCSNNSNMAKVDLVIGGENKGTFYFGDEYPAEYTISNVKHKTGNQKVELIVNADDGNWDAYVDYLAIAAAGTVASSNSSSSNSTSNSNLTANSKLVCLTFDDGPSDTTTNQILDVLEKYDVPATFFLIGQQVTSNTRATMERQLSLGCELGNHSYTHVDMSTLSASDVRNQIEWTSSAIKNTVGYDVKFFRPPYLNTSNTMYQNIDLNFIQGIDSGDWQSSTSANQRVNNVLNNVKDGSIVLMHDFEGNNNTVQALPSIIEGLKKQGYSFVTVSDMFKIKGVNANVEYKIWSNVYD